jgi:thioredoxin-like negative regulator of GroEL
MIVMVVVVDNKSSLDTELGKSGRVLGLFYMSSCPHCNRFMPLFETKTSDLGLPIVKVCLDDYDSSLWDDYHVAAVPTVILFENGQVSKRLDSLLGNCIKNEKFVAWLQEII